MRKLTTLWTENNLETIKSEIDSLIFDEKEWIKWKMWKIAEVTYSYYSEKDFDLNTTLFCDIWEANLREIKKASTEKRKEIILKAKEKLTEKINKKLELIDIYLEKVKNIKAKDKEEKYEIEIIIKALEEKKDLLNYCLNWLPYELEKAGIKVEFDSKLIDKKQRFLDKKIFWGQVKNNPEEIAMSYEDIKEVFDKNKKNLNKEEKARFENYLEKARKLLGKNYEYKKKRKAKSLIEKYEDIKIRDSRYIPWFNLFIEALNWLKHIASQNDEVWSISDWPNSIEFPNNEKFRVFSLPRFLKLNAHEIETHSITDHNHKEIFWNLRWAKSTEKDEWLAKFMERMLEYGRGIFIKDEKTWKWIIDKNKISIPPNFSDILMWEILDNEELLDFLELKEKLSPQKTCPKTIYLRLKRSNKSGVQHKDCSYTRGLFKLVDEVNKYILSNWKEWIKFEDLFLWKVSFDDIKKLKYLKEQNEKKWKKLDIKKPLFASDAIIYFLEQRKKWKKTEEEWFLKKLEKKYPILDLTENKIDYVNRKTKESLALVFNLIKDNDNFLVTLEKAIKRLWEERKKEVIKFKWLES